MQKVENFSFNDGNFVTSATASQVGGWNNETGLLSFDQQVIEDNDYYQSLSYSIRASFLSIKYQTLLIALYTQQVLKTLQMFKLKIVFRSMLLINQKLF